MVRDVSAMGAAGSLSTAGATRQESLNYMLLAESETTKSMPTRIEKGFPPGNSTGLEFKDNLFVNERHDDATFSNLTFEFCTLEKLGFRKACFRHCTFRHCEFLDCYLVGSIFEHCSFLGSFFDKCNFTWAQFPNCELDYTRFSNCAPVLFQIRTQKPKDPQAAAKFFRNLAVEHKNLGNWQEVDRLIYESYKERERHYWNAVTGANDHYKQRYGGSKRLNYAFRYFTSRISDIAWGYGVSWRAFGRSLLLLSFIVLPLVNIIFGHLKTPDHFEWKSSSVQDVVSYIGVVYKTTLQAFLPFIPSNLLGHDVGLGLPFGLVVLEALVGTVFLGLFVSLLFRASSKGG